MNPRRFFVGVLVVAAAAALCVGMAAAADPAKPLKGEWNFAPAAVWSIDRAGADTLMRPGEPRVSRDGKLYFHDFDRHLSYIVGEKGELLGTFAGMGEGPGLVSRYVNCFTSDGRVIVGAMDKLHFYDSEGRFISSTPNNIFASFPLVFTSDDVFFTGPGALANLPDGKASIRRVNVTSGETKPIHEFTMGPDEQVKFGGVILGVIPQIDMAYDPQGGRLYFARNDRYEIFVSDLDGKIVDSFGLPKERVPVTEDDLKHHLLGAGDTGRPAGQNRPEPAPQAHLFPSHSGDRRARVRVHRRRLRVRRSARSTSTSSRRTARTSIAGRSSCRRGIAARTSTRWFSRTASCTRYWRTKTALAG